MRYEELILDQIRLRGSKLCQPVGLYGLKDHSGENVGCHACRHADAGRYCKNSGNRIRKHWCHKKKLLTFCHSRARTIEPLTPRRIVAVEELVHGIAFLAMMFPFSEPPISVGLVAVDVTAWPLTPCPLGRDWNMDNILLYLHSIERKF